MKNRTSVGLGIVFAVAMAAQAFGADQVKVGKSQGFIWDFLPADVGIASGIFAKYGLDVKVSALGGDGKVQQALAAGGIDFGLGSGPGMALPPKGRQHWRSQQSRAHRAIFALSSEPIRRSNRLPTSGASSSPYRRRAR
jgi:hypothetical protein